jgi:dethiobiotin synthetase
MTGRALMLQGTGSDVGKSLLVAGLCRIAARRGIGVAPFKPQNMSNNAAACPGGGEIGRAQALQARAAGLDPSTDMNPVLLKPEGDRRAQVVLNGKALRSEEAAAYMANRGSLLPSVIEAFERLKSAHGLVIIEGAGSPAEVNLRRGDIANMGFARAADVPVVLVGDIDRGGVIASLIGTRAVIEADDAEMVAGFVINRFRGDETLFADGVRFIEDSCGWRSFGIVPWLQCAARLMAGFDARAQGHLLMQHSWFSDAHRAGPDVWSLFWLLSQRRKGLGADPERTHLQRLLEAIEKDSVVVQAKRAPFSKKDLLKARGYRWNADARFWQKELGEEFVAHEQAWFYCQPIDISKRATPWCVLENWIAPLEKIDLELGIVRDEHISAAEQPFD